MVSKQDKVGATKYRKRLGWVPWLELLIGTYFAMTVYYAVDNENYITVPFLLLFVVGYWYTGLMSLLQGRFGGASRRAPPRTPSRFPWEYRGESLGQDRGRDCNSGVYAALKRRDTQRQPQQQVDRET